MSEQLVPRRPLGTSGIDTSQFSLGSWHTYDRMDFADAVAMVSEAHAHGVTLFDVGAYSGPGRPPVFTDVIFSAIVRAAGLRREDWQLSSKIWLDDYRPGTLRGQLTNALFRVGTDYADMGMLADIRTPVIDLEAVVHDVSELLSEGLLRTWGISNWSATHAMHAHALAEKAGIPGPSLGQLKYSVARRAIPDGEPYQRVWAAGMSLQASDVLEGGILAGKITPTREVGRDPGSIREQIIERMPAFTELATELGSTPAQVAIAFTLTHPASATTLFGATSREQLRANLAAVDLLERIGSVELRQLVAPFWADRGVVDPEGP